MRVNERVTFPLWCICKMKATVSSENPEGTSRWPDIYSTKTKTNVKRRGENNYSHWQIHCRFIAVTMDRTNKRDRYRYIRFTCTMKRSASRYLHIQNKVHHHFKSRCVRCVFLLCMQLYSTSPFYCGNNTEWDTSRGRSSTRDIREVLKMLHSE